MELKTNERKRKRNLSFVTVCGAAIDRFAFGGLKIEFEVN